jgi:hypothetical protein
MARIGTVIREVYHRPRSFFPRREYITALAAAVRAYSRGPA